MELPSVAALVVEAGAGLGGLVDFEENQRDGEAASRHIPEGTVLLGEELASEFWRGEGLYGAGKLDEVVEIFAVDQPH